MFHMYFFSSSILADLVAVLDLCLDVTRISGLSYPPIQYCSMMKTFLSATMFPFVHQLPQTDPWYGKGQELLEFYDQLTLYKNI